MFRALENRHVTGTLAVLVFVFSSLIQAQDSLRCPTSIQPPFDMGEVIGQVSHDRWSGHQTTGEFLVDTSISYVSAPDVQDDAAMASDGLNCLAVWSDHRDGAANRNIYGTRVNQGGTILDPASIPISTNNDHEYRPDVASDGTDYLVVWEKLSTAGSFDIYGARVTQSGAVLDPGGIPISTEVNHQQFPAVSFDGANYFVVWSDYRGGYWVIYGARISRAGHVIDSVGIWISRLTALAQYPSVTFDGSNYFVVWQDRRSGTKWDIYGARVSPTGAVLDPEGLVVADVFADKTSPSVTWCQDNYLVVWQDSRNSSLYSARVGRSGAVLDTIRLAGGIRLNPSIIKGWKDCLIAWEQWIQTGPHTWQSDVYGTRISHSGLILDPAPIRICDLPSSIASPKGTFSGTNWTVGWEDGRGACNVRDIYGARVDVSGIVLDPAGFPLSTAVNHQSQPWAVFDGVNFLLVWEDRCAGKFCDIHGTRIDGVGNVLDSVALVISAAANDQRAPRLAYDGNNYLVAWSDFRNGNNIDVFCARLNRNGSCLDTNGIIVTASAGSSQERPSLAFDGLNYLIVWMDYRNGVWDIYGSRVSPAGLVIDSLGIAISKASERQMYPAVDFDGTDYLVVWQDRRRGNWDIYGTRVSQEGVVLDSVGFILTNSSRDQSMPSITFGGTDYFVTWWDGTSNPSYQGLYGARVTTGGVVRDPAGIFIDRKCGQNSAVTFDGRDYIVLSEDTVGAGYDIYAARVTTGGACIERYIVSDQQKNQIFPTIVHGLGGQCLAAYSGWTDSINGRPANTMRIWGKLLSQVGIEEDQISNIRYQTGNLQIYPNPFRRQVKIEFGMGHGAKGIELWIYDISGRMVKSFPLATRSALLATSSIIWDGSDDRGLQLPAGVYFCRLEASELSITRKVLRIK